MYRKRIRKVRRKKEITQKELAEKIGIKHQQYSRYENQENEMTVPVLIKIAEELDVSTDYLLGIETKEEEKKD